VGVGLAKQRLHLAEALEAEALGEAHDGRGVHLALPGDIADAIHHDPVALLADIGGHPFQLARQGLVVTGDAGQQLLDVAGRIGQRHAAEGVVGRGVGGHGLSHGRDSCAGNLTHSPGGVEVGRQEQCTPVMEIKFHKISCGKFVDLSAASF